MDLPPENAKKSNPKEVRSGPLGVAGFIIDAFSKIRKSEPPSPSKTIQIRLITISASHFCEKARWALDILAADPSSQYYYDEDGHPPGFHARYALQASNNKASITPMIVFQMEGEEQKVVWDSPAILEELMPSLYPEAIKEDVKLLEADLGRRLGAGIRCFAYYCMLPDVKTFKGILTEICARDGHVASVERVLFNNMLDKGLADGMMKAMCVNDQTAAASLKAVKEVFQEMSTRLEHSGGEYLMDTMTKSYGFSAADLTLAALAYPILCPPEMVNWTADESKWPTDLVNLANECRETRAGQHVLNMYKKHRPVNDEGKVEVKTAKRDKYPRQSLVLCMSVVCAAVALGVLLSTKESKTELKN